MSKFSKYYTIFNVKWFFTILCVIFGAICYIVAYDSTGFSDEIVFSLALSFAIIIYFVFDKLFEKPTSELKFYFSNLMNDSFNKLREVKGLNDFIEINELQNDFLRYLNEVTSGIVELEQNNLQFEIDNREGYKLKESVFRLQQKLIEIKEAGDQNNWINSGLAQFVDILRTDGESIDQLGRKIISNLAKYTNSNQAGLYILDNEGDNLLQVAFYAYDRDKYTEGKIPKGFGLLWQCLFEKKPIHLTEIPENYVNVNSGLGGAIPKSVLLIPLLLENETFGVIELASFDKYENYQIEFIQKLAENIAASISTARTAERTNKLLKESELKTQEMSAQEEEMRQNMEEMQSTQEEMHRIQKEMELKDYNMKSLLDSSSDTFFAIDKNYKIMIVNKSLTERFRASGVELIEGMTIFDCIPEDQHKMWKKRYDRCLRGEDYSFDSERKLDDKIQYNRAFYKTITNNEGEIIGCSVRSTDISEYNQINLDLMDKSMEVMKLEDQIVALKKNESKTTIVEEANVLTSPKISKAIKDLDKLKKK